MRNFFIMYFCFDFNFLCTRNEKNLLTHQRARLQDSFVCLLFILFLMEMLIEISLIFISLNSLNLYELIKKNNYQGFSLSLIRRFCNSIIKCLRLLYHENGEFTEFSHFHWLILISLQSFIVI